MIGAFARPCTKAVKQFNFSTFKAGKDYMGNEGFNHNIDYMARDAEKVFQQFFKQNPLKQCERSFFNNVFNQNKETMEFDPYRVLGIEPQASKQDIKQAYKQLAMKYHPKKDSSFEARQHFVKISRAYQMLNQEKNFNRNQTSFLNQFKSNVKNLLNSEAGIYAQTTNNDNIKVKNAELYTQTTNIKKVGDKKQVKIEREFNRNGKQVKFTRVQEINQDGSAQVTQTIDNGAEEKIVQTSDKVKVPNVELYSESTNVKKIGDKKQVTIEKQYNKNGKLFKFTRVQDLNPDGTINVSQTIDDGTQVKVNNFVQSSSSTLAN